jgi:hypothetical protein
MSDPKIQELPVGKIRIDGDTQPRMEVYEDVVEDYRRDMARGAQFPPVEVVFDGTDYWLFDGFHRYKAARLAQRKKMTAIIYEGTKEEAAWRSLGANAVHGLRRSREDTAWAIERAIKFHPDRSNRFIARHVGVDHNTVARQRKELESTGEIHQLEKLQGVDGRWRPAHRWGAVRSPRALARAAARARAEITDEITGEYHQSRRMSDFSWRWRARIGPFESAALPPPEYDFAGHRIPKGVQDRLAYAFDYRPELDRMVKLAQRLQEDLMMGFSRRNRIFAGFDWTWCDNMLEQMLMRLRSICPHSVCPRCQGAGCEICDQRGWVNKERLEEIDQRPGALPPPVEVA